ncbi:reverse transcriptase domain-containing protein [Tanacetum coccineum]
MSIRLADRSFQYPVGIAENMLIEVVIRVKQKQLNLGVGTEQMIFNIDSAIKHSYLNDDTCFSIDVVDEILEEDFDALLDEGSKILRSIEGTVLEEEIFSEFDKFIAMTADEIYDSESDTEEPPFEKITINTDYKIKITLEEPPTDLELKPLPDNLEYVFLEEPSFLLGIDFMGPFPKSLKFEYLLVAVDYVLMAKPQALQLRCAGGYYLSKETILLIQKSQSSYMEKTMKRYGVNHRFYTSYHPQTSGQVENTNRALKRILEKTVKDNPAFWPRKLDDALWAFRTAYKTPTGTTLYKLI